MMGSESGSPCEKILTPARGFHSSRMAAASASISCWTLANTTLKRSVAMTVLGPVPVLGTT
eukprot:1006275-Pyramimonas_sp.AAC.1